MLGHPKLCWRRRSVVLPSHQCDQETASALIYLELWAGLGVSSTRQVRKAPTCEVAFLMSSNNADWGKFRSIFVISSGEEEEWPSQGWQKLPRKGGGKKNRGGTGGAFSVHHQEILNLESGLATGDLLSHRAMRESSSSSGCRCSWWGEFQSNPGELLGEFLTKRNRGKSLIYFYLEWGNRNLIFWPSHLEIAAELVRGVSGRPILCLFQNRRGCTAVNNDKIWPVSWVCTDEAVVEFLWSAGLLYLCLQQFLCGFKVSIKSLKGYFYVLCTISCSQNWRIWNKAKIIWSWNEILDGKC